MREIKFRAMRAAGIICFVVLVAIGIWVFTTPASDIVDALKAMGQLVGGGPVYGTFLLVALPPFSGFIAYHIWRWVIK